MATDYIIQQKKNEILSLPTIEIKREQLKTLASELSNEILKILKEKPAYPIEIAKKLKVHEQKVYYHIRKLERAGLINAVEHKRIHGALTTFYGLTESAFYFKLGEFKPMHKGLSHLKTQHRKFLEPFIKNGELNALIIVGSPDPHGPQRARSRDGYYGIDFALFLGTFLNYVPKLNVRLDTEVHDTDLEENNIIIIGGPIVNSISQKINGKLPINFDANQNWAIHSNLSQTTYLEESHGMIVKAPNPYNEKKHVLWIAGRRHAGTRAAIIAFLKGFSQITAGNKHDSKYIAKVVEGIDLDSDGIVDDVEFRE